MADFSQDQIEQIRQIVTEAIQTHSHDGNDSRQIDPTFLLGFPVSTSAPTYDAPDGTIVLTDVAGTRSIYLRISGAWYSEVVT